MFRVPSSADRPSFDDTFKVGALRWLTSRSGERREWMRRRNAAAKAAEADQNARGKVRIQAWADRQAARKARRRRG